MIESSEIFFSRKLIVLLWISCLLGIVIGHISSFLFLFTGKRISVALIGYYLIKNVFRIIIFPIPFVLIVIFVITQKNTPEALKNTFVLTIIGKKYRLSIIFVLTIVLLVFDIYQTILKHLIFPLINLEKTFTLDIYYSINLNSIIDTIIFIIIFLIVKYITRSSNIKKKSTNRNKASLRLLFFKFAILFFLGFILGLEIYIFLSWFFFIDDQIFLEYFTIFIFSIENYELLSYLFQKNLVKIISIMLIILVNIFKIDTHTNLKKMKEKE